MRRMVGAINGQEEVGHKWCSGIFGKLVWGLRLNRVFLNQKTFPILSNWWCAEF